MTPTPDAVREAMDDLRDIAEDVNRLNVARASALAGRIDGAVDKLSRAQPDSGNVRIEVTDSAEVERLRELLEDFFDEDVEALRLHPDIPWGIGGKSGAEHVAEWREDLANRIERVLAAFRAAQDHHTTTGGPDDGQ